MIHHRDINEQQDELNFPCLIIENDIFFFFFMCGVVYVEATSPTTMAID